MTNSIILGLQFLFIAWLVQPSKKPSYSRIQQGKASYYGREFEGRKTANGEIFRNADYTAAHRTLPFNSYVRTTNTKNNLSITVRVTDRGPFVRTRIIDLSESAARRIGSYQHGLATVKVEVLNIIRKTKELDSVFTCEDVLDCLGNNAALKGYSISLWKTKDIVHMIYVANELYLHEDIKEVLIVVNGVGENRMYHLVISNYPTKKAALESKDYFEKKGFMTVKYFQLSR
jgi:hypothetical protein